MFRRTVRPRCGGSESLYRIVPRNKIAHKRQHATAAPNNALNPLRCLLHLFDFLVVVLCCCVRRLLLRLLSRALLRMGRLRRRRRFIKVAAPPLPLVVNLAIAVGPPVVFGEVKFFQRLGACWWGSSSSGLWRWWFLLWLLRLLLLPLLLGRGNGCTCGDRRGG